MLLLYHGQLDVLKCRCKIIPVNGFREKNLHIWRKTIWWWPHRFWKNVCIGCTVTVARYILLITKHVVCHIQKHIHIYLCAVFCEHAGILYTAISLWYVDAFTQIKHLAMSWIQPRIYLHCIDKNQILKMKDRKTTLIYKVAPLLQNYQ